MLIFHIISLFNFHYTQSLQQPREVDIMINPFL